MNRFSALVSALALSTAFGTALAQGAPPPGGPPGPPPGGPRRAIPITVQKLNDHFVLLKGGTNTLLALGTSGIIAIDAGAGTAEAVVKNIKDVSPLPVKYLIISDPDPDHVAANAALHGEGAVVVATQGGAMMMSKDRPEFGTTIPAVLLAGRPTIVVDTAKTLSIPGLTAEIHAVLKAHTTGDSYIWFPQYNLIDVGDLIHTAEWPVYDNYGSFTGQIAALDQILSVINDQTIVVAARGPTTDKAHVEAFRDALSYLKVVIREDLKNGITRDQVIASKPLAGKAETALQTHERDNADQFVGQAYDDIKNGQ